MAVFLVVHGAWSSAWAWKKMRPLLRERGHEVFTPTHTGLGERAHLASAAIDLESHIADVRAVIEYEDLREIVLVGHSYGGMVATGVADRLPDRIARLVYLDAFVPRAGESLLDLVGAPAAERMRAAARDSGNGWRLPPNPMPPDTPEADLAWAVPRRAMQPLATFAQPLKLGGQVERLARTYIYCTRAGPGDPFRRFAERARAEPGWRLHELDSSHNPHITLAAPLADLFDAIARR